MLHGVSYMMLACIISYNFVQHRICIASYYVMLHHITYTVSRHITPYRIIPYYIIPGHIIILHILMYHFASYHTYHIILYNTSYLALHYYIRNILYGKRRWWVDWVGNGGAGKSLPWRSASAQSWLACVRAERSLSRPRALQALLARMKRLTCLTLRPPRKQISQGHDLYMRCKCKFWVVHELWRNSTVHTEQLMRGT